MDLIINNIQQSEGEETQETELLWITQLLLTLVSTVAVI